MRERASVDRATVPNMSLSPLDKDILNLFTASEVELPDGPGQLQANLQEVKLFIVFCTFANTVIIFLLDCFGVSIDS